MLRVFLSASVALMLTGCASIPEPSRPQVNRTAKADKYVAPKAAKVEMPTPNQVIKKRWFPKFKIKWVN